MAAVWLVMLLVMLAGLTLAACGPDAAQAQAHQNKAKLDQELSHARKDLGLPDSLLQPVVTKEQQVASGDGGLFYNYSDAATEYSQLYTQLLSIEQSAPDALKTQAQADLQAFATILNQRQAEGFIEVSAYQARFDQAQQLFNAAQTPADYAQVSALATAQTQALQAMWPAYQKLQDFQALIASLHSAGIASPLADGLYQQDLTVFRDAASADRYETLQKAIDGQIVQLIADQTSSQPYVTATLLQTFQARIDLLRQYGDTKDADTYQQQHDADAQQLAGASQLADYITVAQTITQQDSDIAFPLIKAKGKYDLGILQQLVDYAQSKTVTNPADGKQYPIAPEYADPNLGVGDAASDLHAARTLTQYEKADFKITSLTTGLREMLDNMNDATPQNEVHKSDLELMSYYHVTGGRVVMVSLREQVARFYENGNLVYWSLVTTGRPELPSWPGYHTAFLRLSPTIFTSPDPVGSQNYYQPTPIHYAVGYAAGGFFLHDAWWRSQFGQYTNLPHHDPAAFNGGSHGCVNFPLENMQWVYNFVVLGTPIILY
jgi:hypothetical protein